MKTAAVRIKPRDLAAVQFMRHRLAVLEGLRQELRGQPNTLVSVRELRHRVQLPKADFDRAALELSSEHLVVLHEHDFPSSLPPEQLAELVAGPRGQYFIGIAATPSFWKSWPSPGRA